MSGLVVDLFAGGGGASTGIEAALGRDVDIAINHDETALAVHRVNHPRTRHLEADIWEVKPREAVGGRPVELLWASPDCTHFSVAKGDVPRCSGRRSLAWAVVRWAKDVRPRVILLENVREFQGWGPLGKDGRPDRARAGKTFGAWVGALERAGYVVEWRVLDASAFGAPTRRRRLFVCARRDRLPIRWPKPTHGPGLLPYRTASECIDWSIPCPSIFERKKPLAPKTLWRVAEGIKRYVLESASPFIVEMNHSNKPRGVDEPLGVVTTQHNRFNLVTPFVAKVNHGKDEHRGAPLTEPLSTVTATQRGHAIIAPTLVQTGYGEREGQRPRALDIEQPLGTCVSGQKHALVSAFLDRHFGDRGRGETYSLPLDGPVATVTARDHHSLTAASLVKLRGECHGADLAEPAPTITAAGNHIAEVRAFLTTYYGGPSPRGASLFEPLRTQTTENRFGLVTVAGIDYAIVDIGLRMLEPHELLRAQFGTFAERYDLSAARTKSVKVRLIGNSVCPAIAEALVRANMVEHELAAVAS